MSDALRWILHGGPLNGYKRQLGILLWVLSRFFPQLAVIDVVDGISDSEILLLWGFISAELKKVGIFSTLIEKLARLLAKITG
jgi:hypothetical protein